MKNVCVLFAGIILLAGGAFAQNPEPVFSGPGMMFFQKGPADAGTRIGSSYNYVYTSIVGSGELVKGAPYTATAVTESTQALADGNRIVNKTSTFLARDGEGRTRREMAMGIGPLPPGAPKTVLISDPVAKTDYMLNLQEQTARAVKRENGKAIFIEQSGKSDGEQKARQESEQKIKIKLNAERAGAVGMAVSHLAEPGELKHEDLGTQVIEGISCTGSRETRTIAAGAIGNERPLEITSETWKSPDLHTIVLSKHNDPRFGETVYKLTDVKRNEPDPALFQVPSNYKITESETPSFKP